MPVFEYACKSCGHSFEEFVHSTNQGPGKCPSCGRKPIERKLSVFSAREQSIRDSASFGGGCGQCGDPDGPCAN
ncbi:MAG: FmdB family zinc ribbon protein [Planctomycetota bacterium]|jgi:putative FmdB family regulatory protein